MSVLTQNESHTPSMEMDSNNNNNNNNESGKNKRKRSGRESTQHKKDYVYKFWMALCQQCEPVITEYRNLQEIEEKENIQRQREFDIKDNNDTKANDNNNNNNNNEHKNTSKSNGSSASGTMSFTNSVAQMNKNNNNKMETETNETVNSDVIMKEASTDVNGNNNNNNNNNNENSENSMPALTFDKLRIFMGNKQLIMLVGKFWSVLKAFINNEAIGKESIKDARTILASLMVSMFPRDVLDVADVNDMDALSEACYTSAQKLVKQVFDKESQFTPCFQSSSHDDNDKNGKKLTRFHCQQAYKAINNFFDAFKDWQLQDKTKILESVLNFYEQWQRSYKVLQTANMNEAQKEGVLKTISSNINNIKKKMLQLVNNNENEMNQLCNKIDEKIKNEENDENTHHSHLPQHGSHSSNLSSFASNNQNSNTNSNSNMNNSSSNNHGNNENENENKNDKPLSIEEQLRARGVPVNMKTGSSLISNNEKKEDNNNENDNNNDEISKYLTETENGEKVLNLDSIIMEEASKKYWIDFEKEIENENWSRLFELLSEILERVKKLSPAKDHKMLDDLIDVSFIQQTISNGLIDANGFYGIFYGIWKELRSLHAPVNDNEWDKWHDNILNDMQKSDATWAKLLSNVFNTFLLKIDEIEDQVNVIRQIQANKSK